MARLMMILGATLLVGGIVWHFFGRELAKLGFGSFPGDFSLKGERYELHAPLATCIVISVVISLVLWIIRRLN